MVLELVKGSLGTPNALFSRVRVGSFLGSWCCELNHGFKPVLCKLLKVHAICLGSVLLQ